MDCNWVPESLDKSGIDGIENRPIELNHGRGINSAEDVRLLHMRIVPQLVISIALASKAMKQIPRAKADRRRGGRAGTSSPHPSLP